MSGIEGYTGVSCGNVKGVKTRVFMRDSVINQQVPSGAPLAFQTDYAGSIPVIPSSVNPEELPYSNRLCDVEKSRAVKVFLES